MACRYVKPYLGIKKNPDRLNGSQGHFNDLTCKTVAAVQACSINYRRPSNDP